MEQQWFWKNYCSVKWRGLLDATAVELLCWTSHIEKNSFLYFYTSLTFIIACRMTPRIEQHIQENLHFLLDLPVPITVSTFDKNKSQMNTY